jgi:hypothetical protein
MKTIISMAAMAAVLAGTGYAQMSALPPASSTDGVLIQPIGLNSGPTHWDSTSSIGSFKPVSTTDGTANINSAAYNPTGLPFAAPIPMSLQSRLTTLNTNGGIIRTIFLGESAQWVDSFGYTYSGAFAGPESFTAFAKVEANPSSGIPVNAEFGQYFDVNLAAGAATKFDFWFQGENATYGGDYTLFHPSDSSPASENVLWGQQSITANTWNATLNAYVDVSTYVVGIGDWRQGQGRDGDFSDGVYAFQFYTPSGAPDLTAVPEPSTYGLIGSAALLALVALRRYSRLNDRKKNV